VRNKEGLELKKEKREKRLAKEPELIWSEDAAVGPSPGRWHGGTGRVREEPAEKLPSRRPCPHCAPNSAQGCRWISKEQEQNWKGHIYCVLINEKGKHFVVLLNSPC
jgi:hypothetical protein